MSEDVKSRLAWLRATRPGPLPKDVPVVLSCNATRPNASKSDGTRKGDNIKIRCTEDEKKGYQSRAQQEGLTLSAWMIKQLEMGLDSSEGEPE